MKRTTAIAITAAPLSLTPLAAQEPAIPRPVTSADFPSLLERQPFRQILSLSQSLVLSGVATLPSGPMITIWDRASSRSFMVTSSPNAQGWKLESLTSNPDLRSVSATISAGSERLTVRFDPDRLTPPKLDNTSKPAPRSENAVVVEALLRSLDPAAARSFESLPPSSQESFRKSFSEYLSAYPTASNSRRLSFVQRALEEAAPAPSPDTSADPSTPSLPPPENP